MWLQLRILIMTQIYKIKQNGIFAGNFGVGLPNLLPKSIN